MSIIAASYDAQFAIAAPVVTGFDESNSPIIDRYDDLADMPIFGRLSSYSSANSQSQQGALAGEEQSRVLYKFVCDFRKDFKRGYRVKKLQPGSTVPDDGPGTEVFLINIQPVGTYDHLVCVCEEYQEGIKIR